jgi:hypothetical protein
MSHEPPERRPSDGGPGDPVEPRDPGPTGDATTRSDDRNDATDVSGASSNPSWQAPVSGPLAGASPSQSAAATRKTVDERKESLSRAVASQLGLGQRRIETQGDFNAVIVVGQPVNHVLHAIITIFSCGLWGIVWLVLALSGGEKREMITVDEFGHTMVQQLN